MPFISMKKQTVPPKTENQLEAIGILLSKIMALGVLKLDIIEEILVILKLVLNARRSTEASRVTIPVKFLASG